MHWMIHLFEGVNIKNFMHRLKSRVQKIMYKKRFCLDVSQCRNKQIIISVKTISLRGIFYLDVSQCRNKLKLISP